MPTSSIGGGWPTRWDAPGRPLVDREPEIARRLPSQRAIERLVHRRRRLAAHDRLALRAFGPQPVPQRQAQQVRALSATGQPFIFAGVQLRRRCNSNRSRSALRPAGDATRDVTRSRGRVHTSGLVHQSRAQGLLARAVLIVDTTLWNTTRLSPLSYLVLSLRQPSVPKCSSPRRSGIPVDG